MNIHTHIKVRIIALLFKVDVSFETRMTAQQDHALFMREEVMFLSEDTRKGLRENGVVKIPPKVACQYLRCRPSKDRISTFEVGSHIASFEKEYLEELTQQGWILCDNEIVAKLGLREILTLQPTLSG